MSQKMILKKCTNDPKRYFFGNLVSKSQRLIRKGSKDTRSLNNNTRVTYGIKPCIYLLFQLIVSNLLGI